MIGGGILNGNSRSSISVRAPGSDEADDPMIAAPPETPAAPSRARRAAAGVVFAVALTAFAATTRSSDIAPPEMPSPNRGADAERASEAARRNLACESCHADIAAEWRASHHRSAFTDQAFQRSLAAEEENVAFCRGCHAPEAPPDALPPPELAAIGVACVTCHSAGDHLLAAPSSSPSAAPHASLRAEAFATARACAGCHEFDFPDSVLRPRPEKMQFTASEHAASGYSEAACAGCHMPLVGEGARRHRSHAFASSRSPEGHRKALSISADRIGNTIEMKLGAGEVGHAFPTGDLFRRLTVTAEIIGPDRALLASQTRYLARHFRPELLPSGRKVRVTDADDRPGAPAQGGEPVKVRFDFGPALAGQPAVVRVVYQRVAHALGGFEKDALIESEAVLFERELAPGDPAAARAEER